MEKEIELKFIEQVLQKYGARLRSSLIREITDKDLISKKGSAHLKNSIRYDVMRTGISGYKLNLFFPDHGRFIEIRYHTGIQRNRDLAFNRQSVKSSINRTTVGSKALQRTTLGKQLGQKKKDTRWYSKTTYGSLNSLVGELMYGLTDAVQQSLKEQLNQPL
jgi:hypothetical protein